MSLARLSTCLVIPTCLLLCACSSKDSHASTAAKSGTPAPSSTAPATTTPATSATTTPATTTPATGTPAMNAATAQTAAGMPTFSMPADKDLTTTKSGLKYQAVKTGSGPKPKATDTVTIHYWGWTTDGKLFDSSQSHGIGPVTYPLQKFIAGWVEGLQLMPVGSTFKFVVPANLGYGSSPPPGSGIPNGATLVFQVELVKIGT